MLLLPRHSVNFAFRSGKAYYKTMGQTDNRCAAVKPAHFYTGVVPTVRFPYSDFSAAYFNKIAAAVILQSYLDYRANCGKALKE